MATPTAACVAAFQHYLDKGIGRNVAAGIVGVLNYESGLNPVSENLTGTETGGVLSKGSFGVAQWNGPRQQDLQTFALAKNESVSNINTQLDFVLTECANSYPTVWAAIQANMAVTDFVSLFVNKYENPKSPMPEIAAGIATATALIALPVQPAPVPTPTPVPTPIPMPIPSPVTPESTPITDPELVALDQMVTIMSTLPPASVARVIAYLSSRF
jgi:Phage tail lysozyme